MTAMTADRFDTLPIIARNATRGSEWGKKIEKEVMIFLLGFLIQYTHTQTTNDHHTHTHTHTHTMRLAL